MLTESDRLIVIHLLGSALAWDLLELSLRKTATRTGTDSARLALSHLEQMRLMGHTADVAVDKIVERGGELEDWIYAMVDCVRHAAAEVGMTVREGVAR